MFQDRQWGTAATAPVASLALALTAGAAVSPGMAQPRGAAGGGNSLEDLVEAETVAELVQAVELLALEAPRGASEALSARIRQGLPAEALLRAVDTLLLLDEPGSSGPVLLELTRHRRREVRRKAVTAVGELRPRGAAAALRTSVGDGDRAVRETAMLALGRMGDADAVPVLFAALERGASRALVPLARLVDGAGARRILGRLGSTPLDQLGPALRVLATRGDLPVEVRLEVARKVGDLGTRRARGILEDVEAELPARGVPADLRELLEDALRRLPDA